MNMPTGPDVSSNQPHPIDWHQVAGAGHTFAVVKATEGWGYKNPYFVQDVQQARAAGLIVWPYHWMSPGNSAGQGAWAVSVIRQVFGPGTLVWLDFEQAGVTHADLDGTRDVIEQAAFKTGTYTYPDFWSRVGDPGCRGCGDRPLWWADYNPAHNRPAPAPWSQVALRQTHGTSFAVPGIGGLSDMSRAEIDLAHLVHGAPAPAPHPTPAPPPAPSQEVNVAALPTLKAGDSGQRVRNMQGLLEANGQPVSIDGQFGSGTANALRSWQGRAGLGADGVCGPHTWSRLIGV